MRRLDCVSNQGGACFELTGDERETHLAVRDDEDWQAVPVRYQFIDAAGQPLSEGENSSVVACRPRPTPGPGTAIAAHEIGHLFGGSHDYATCVEGVLVARTPFRAVPAP